MKFKTRIKIGMVALAIQATAFAGGGVGGATEMTQIANKLQLILAYEQQVESYVRQGLQLQAQLQNLVSNPTSLLGPEIGQMINTIGKIMDTGQSIGYNVAQIDKKFAETFKNPKAADFSKMFTSWHKTNTDTLEAALKSIGTMREQYPSSQAALTDLYNRSQSTKGNLDALQTLSQVNIRQIQELQSLKELLGTQAQAQATYMATQTARASTKDAALEEAQKILEKPIPKFQNNGQKQKFEPFNFYKTN